MSSTAPFQDQLAAAVRAASDAHGADWLNQALGRLAASDDVDNELLNLSAAARRKLGNQPFPDPSLALRTEQATLHFGHWNVGDAGRVVLLMQACRQQPDGDRRERLMFRSGDETERAAIVQALLLMDDPGELKALALEAGRANSLALFGAIALDNPYPALYYSDHEFNQIVLKSLFTGLSIARVQGLQERANAELSKMSEDYIDEREAAARSVPVDIWLAVAPFATDHGNALLQRYLDHSQAEHRFYAAKALSLCGRPGLLGDIDARLRHESDPAVREVLAAAGDQSGD